MQSEMEVRAKDEEVKKEALRVEAAERTEKLETTVVHLRTTLDQKVEEQQSAQQALEASQSEARIALQTQHDGEMAALCAALAAAGVGQSDWWVD